MITITGDDYQLGFDHRDELLFDDSFFFGLMHGIFEDKHVFAKQSLIQFAGDTTDIKICAMNGSVFEVILEEPHSTTLKEFLSQRFQ